MNDLTWYDWLGMVGIGFFVMATWQVLFGVAPDAALMNMIGVTGISGVAFYIGYRVSKEY